MTAGIPPEFAHLPVCPRRLLPIPFIAEIGDDGIGNFGVLDPKRARECYATRLCATCGLHMGDEVTLIGDVVSLEPGGFWIEPPVHERCAELAVGGWCPFISRERVPRRAMEDDGTIAVLGSLEALATVGRPEGPAKRPVAMGVYRNYRMASHFDAPGMPVYVTFEAPLRTRLWEWRDNLATEVQVPAAEPALSGAQSERDGRAGPGRHRRQPRRKSRAERRGKG